MVATCNDLNELRDEIDLLYEVFPKMFFRGQPRQEYKLESSIDRLIKSYDSEIPKEFYLEKQLEEFRRRIRGRIEDKEIFTDDTLAWSIGQHYGLKTPYLDWSRSPYIALFFCSIEDQTEDGGLNLELSAKIGDYLRLRLRSYDCYSQEYALITRRSLVFPN